MKPTLRLLFLIILFIGAIWFSFWIDNASAQNADQILQQVYGAQKTGCTQVSVTTTGHNRSAALTANRRYLIYGYNGSDISQGDALRCVFGTSSVDVTGLGGSLVGQIIYANQQQVFLVKPGFLYVSCISKTASMKYDICPLD